MVGDEQRGADKLGRVEHSENDHSTFEEPRHASAATDGLDVPVYVDGNRDGRHHEPFDAHSDVVLASHEHKGADDEDAGHARQRV